MDYEDVKTGRDFQKYLKENEMITSCLSEKYLEYVRRCQQTIKNITSMREKERKFYTERGIDLHKVLVNWEATRLAYIRLALSQCEFKSQIYNLNGWISVTNEYKKKLMSGNFVPINVEYEPISDEKMAHIENFERELGRL